MANSIDFLKQTKSLNQDTSLLSSENQTVKDKPSLFDSLLSGNKTTTTQNSNNTELGFEILGILDQTYLEKQARMIGRVTLLFKDGKIPKQDFDKYTYISTRLNSHLILLIDELYSIETNQDDPEFEFDIENPNMEFISFQFLVEVPSPLNLDGKTKIARYKRTNSFFYFYENIFKD